MCRSLSSGETPRRCPCTSPNKRSAYERGKRAADKAGLAFAEETIGREVESGETDIPFEQEAKVLIEDISRMYASPAHRRFRAYQGQDEDIVKDLEGDDPVPLETRLNSVIRLGHIIVQRGEELAGITSEEVVERAKEHQETIKVKSLEIETEIYNLNRDKNLFIDQNVGVRTSMREAQIVYETAAKRMGEDSADARALRDGYERATEWIDGYDKKLFQFETQINDLRKKKRAYDEGYLLPEQSHLLHNLVSEDLDRLSNGYLEALRELRAVGGDMVFNNKNKTKAVDVFKRAARDVYPSDWIEYSNKAPYQPFARNLDRRAHYVHNSSKTTYKTVPAGYIDYLERDQEWPSDGAYVGYEPVTTEEARYEFGSVRDDETYYRLVEYEPDFYYSGKRDADGKPLKGTGWKQFSFTDSKGDEHTIWRRKRMKRVAVESEFTPEITTTISDDERYANVKAHNGYATAIHELAHRFEYTVPEIVDMERDFFEYRTKGEDGTQNEKTRIYKGRNEFGREGGFINKYMGKEYKWDAFELMSCGMEGIFGHNYGALIRATTKREVKTDGVTSDPHMKAFVLGVLASAGRVYPG